MTYPDFSELAANGRAFRNEAFTDEFVAGVGPHVHQIPDAVIGQYAKTDYHYISTSIERPVVEQVGLYPGMPLIDPEDDEFFSGQFAEQQFRNMDPNDQLVAESFVFGRKQDGTPKDTVLYGDVTPDRIALDGVSERLKFFMRNMRALATLPEADPEARTHAEEIAQKYSGRLITDDRVDLSVFAISPRSPSMGRVFLHPLLTAQGIEDGIDIIGMTQSNVNRIEVPGMILPEHLTLTAVHSFASSRVLRSIFGSESMIVFKPARTQ